jgi:hypothetical protein
MKTILRIAISACFIAGLFAVAEARSRCSRVSAQGEGLTKELATEMAKINLGFSIAAKNAKASGRIHVRCSPGMLMLTSCTARQRACS